MQPVHDLTHRSKCSALNEHLADLHLAARNCSMSIPHKSGGRAWAWLQAEQLWIFGGPGAEQQMPSYDHNDW